MTDSNTFNRDDIKKIMNGLIPSYYQNEQGKKEVCMVPKEGATDEQIKYAAKALEDLILNTLDPLKEPEPLDGLYPSYPTYTRSQYVDGIRPIDVIYEDGKSTIYRGADLGAIETLDDIADSINNEQNILDAQAIRAAYDVSIEDGKLSLKIRNEATAEQVALALKKLEHHFDAKLPENTQEGVPLFAFARRMKNINIPDNNQNGAINLLTLDGYKIPEVNKIEQVEAVEEPAVAEENTNETTTATHPKVGDKIQIGTDENGNPITGVVAAQMNLSIKDDGRIFATKNGQSERIGNLYGLSAIENNANKKYIADRRETWEEIKKAHKQGEVTVNVIDDIQPYSRDRAFVMVGNTIIGEAFKATKDRSITEQISDFAKENPVRQAEVITNSAENAVETKPKAEETIQEDTENRPIISQEMEEALNKAYEEQKALETKKINQIAKAYEISQTEREGVYFRPRENATAEELAAGEKALREITEEKMKEGRITDSFPIIPMGVMGAPKMFRASKNVASIFSEISETIKAIEGNQPVTEEMVAEIDIPDFPNTISQTDEPQPIIQYKTLQDDKIVIPISTEEKKAIQALKAAAILESNFIVVADNLEARPWVSADKIREIKAQVAPFLETHEIIEDERIVGLAPKNPEQAEIMFKMMEAAKTTRNILDTYPNMANSPQDVFKLYEDALNQTKKQSQQPRQGSDVVNGTIINRVVEPEIVADLTGIQISEQPIEMQEDLSLIPPKQLVQMYKDLNKTDRTPADEKKMDAIGKRMDQIVADYISGETVINQDNIADIYDGMSEILELYSPQDKNANIARNRLNKEIEKYDRENHLDDIVKEDGPYLSDRFDKVQSMLTGNVQLDEYRNNIEFTDENDNVVDKETALSNLKMLDDVVKTNLLTEMTLSKGEITPEDINTRANELFEINTVALIAADLKRQGKDPLKAPEIVNGLKNGEKYKLPQETLNGFIQTNVNKQLGLMDRLATKVGKDGTVVKKIYEPIQKLDKASEKRFETQYPKTNLLKTCLKKFAMGSFAGALASGAGLGAMALALPSVPVVAGVMAAYTGFTMWKNRKDEVKKAKEQGKERPSLKSFFKKNTVRALLTGASLGAIALGTPAIALGIGAAAAAVGFKGIFKRNREEGFDVKTSILRTLPESVATIAGSILTGGATHDLGTLNATETLTQETPTAEPTQPTVADTVQPTITTPETTGTDTDTGTSEPSQQTVVDTVQPAPQTITDTSVQPVGTTPDTTGTDAGTVTDTTGTDAGTDTGTADGGDTNPTPPVTEEPVQKEAEEPMPTLDPIKTEEVEVAPETPITLEELNPEIQRFDINSEGPITLQNPEIEINNAGIDLDSNKPMTITEDMLRNALESETSKVSEEAITEDSNVRTVDTNNEHNTTVNNEQVHHTYETSAHERAYDRLSGEGLYDASGRPTLPDYTPEQLDNALKQIRALEESHPEFKGGDGTSNADILMYKLNQFSKLIAPDTDLIINGEHTTVADAFGIKMANGTIYTPEDLRVDLLLDKSHYLTPEQTAEMLGKVELAIDAHGRFTHDIIGFNESRYMSYEPGADAGFKVEQITPTPAVETTPTAEQTPAETQTPQTEGNETPTAETTPAVETTPTVEQTPAETQTPQTEGNETPTAETTPAVETTPTVEQTPAETQTPQTEGNETQPEGPYVPFIPYEKAEEAKTKQVLASHAEKLPPKAPVLAENTPNNNVQSVEKTITPITDTTNNSPTQAPKEGVTFAFEGAQKADNMDNSSFSTPNTTDNVFTFDMSKPVDKTPKKETPIEQTNTDKGTSKQTFNEQGKLIGESYRDTNDEGKDVTYRYDADGNLYGKDVVDTQGNEDATLYDKDGKVTGEIHLGADGEEKDVTYHYDADGKLYGKDVVDTQGNQVSTLYDKDGKITGEIHLGADGESTDITYSYDEEGHLCSKNVIDKEGNETSTLYDKDGNIVLQNPEEEHKDNGEKIDREPIAPPVIPKFQEEQSDNTEQKTSEGNPLTPSEQKAVDEITNAGNTTIGFAAEIQKDMLKKAGIETAPKTGTKNIFAGFSQLNFMKQKDVAQPQVSPQNTSDKQPFYKALFTKRGQNK